MITDKSANDDEVTPDEDALMRNLFAIVRISSLKKKKQGVRDRLRLCCSNVQWDHSKSMEFLLRRWEGLKRTQNRDKNRKVNEHADEEIVQRTISPRPGPTNESGQNYQGDVQTAPANESKQSTLSTGHLAAQNADVAVRDAGSADQNFGIPPQHQLMSILLSRLLQLYLLLHIQCFGIPTPKRISGKSMHNWAKPAKGNGM
ncbi:hypothetical protein PHYPSEUDO_002078 [Phytophthora pseudosyringae]|uniref:Uncharacterized protein n=1 Tax=Phytophthora pseudosyringae TaxID=221518 RepID=A0A8T1VU14_9STRA|nr:hypothetical protein PHYPSEUDO_002078 [Phytophthora pseudosyringae]